MGSKYDIKKYNQGGSSFNYDDNEAYLQYTWGQVQKESDAATQKYNQSQSDAVSDYRNYLNELQNTYNKNLQTTSAVKTGINTALNAPTEGPGTPSWKQSINTQISDRFDQWFGPDPNDYGVYSLNDLNAQKSRADKSLRQSKIKANRQRSIYDDDYFQGMEYEMTYDQWSDWQNRMADMDPNINEADISRKSYRDYKRSHRDMMSSKTRDAQGYPLSEDKIEEMKTASQGELEYSRQLFGGTSKEAMKYAKEMKPAVGTGFSTAAGETYAVTKGGKVVKTASDFGSKSTGVVVDSAGEVVKGSVSAPIKGGGWTMAADIGLHYLSDDNDPSTYTTGEVLTDVGSLALDVLTFDWIGAVLQVGDMVMQGTTAKKQKKEMKKAKQKLKDKQWEAGAEFTDDWYAARKQPFDQRFTTGKRSGFSNTGYGNLGGFKYNI